VPRLIITSRARQGLRRCYAFLRDTNPQAGKQAGHTIAHRLAALEANPSIGRPVPGALAMRELIIAFGNTGYVALYHHDPARDAVIVLAFRHQREAGYK
jgi:plasmid stabilization system protein ParE